MNIEREMLAVVFRAERFCTYIYGWSFTIESDHKPLESISRKNLADTPAWLQGMMLPLQGYDLTIHYHPGKETVIPDLLSWFSPWPGPDLPLDIAIHHAHIMPNCKEAFQQAFINDPKMQALADLIITGWPKDIKEVPHPSACTGNTERLSLSRTVWSCEVKHLSFLLPNRRGSCINCINSIKE